jgi:hypothetical protein
MQRELAFSGGLGMIDAGGESDEDDLTKMDQVTRGNVIS